jgi:hypothetical protein
MCRALVPSETSYSGQSASASMEAFATDSNLAFMEMLLPVLCNIMSLIYSWFLNKLNFDRCFPVSILLAMVVDDDDESASDSDPSDWEFMIVNFTTRA